MARSIHSANSADKLGTGAEIAECNGASATPKPPRYFRGLHLSKAIILLTNNHKRVQLIALNKGNSMLYNLPILIGASALLITSQVVSAKEQEDEPQERIMIKGHYRTK